MPRKFSVFPLLLLGAVSAAVSAAGGSHEKKYTTWQMFPQNDSTCIQKPVQLFMEVVDVCLDGAKLTVEDDSITQDDDDSIVLTAYLYSNCTGKTVATNTAPINKCSRMELMGDTYAIFSEPEPFTEACSVLTYPVVAGYLDNECTDLVAVDAPMSCRVLENNQSTMDSCNSNATAVTCVYANNNCQGEGECEPISDVPTGDCVKNGDYWVKAICPSPDNDNPIFCTPSKHHTTKKATGLTSGAIGGIVAAVILIPLAIIVAAVVAFVCIRKKQTTNTHSLMNDDKDTTSYGTT